MGLLGAVAENTCSDVAELRRLREGAGWMPLRETGWIAVTGEDRVRWLNGMVTNSVQELGVGEGAYTFLLNAQGRIQGDGTVWAEAERLLMETDLRQVGPMMAWLERFVIMDDVELAAPPTEGCGLVVAGPVAAERLGAVGVPRAALTADSTGGECLRRAGVSWRGREVWVNAGTGAAVPRFELWLADAGAAEEMAVALQGAEVARCDEAAFELLRIVEARPRFGVDIRDKDLAQETGQTRALHFNKGCYLGQEIVERIRSRGQVHRGFTQFRLLGGVPVAGTELTAEGRTAGVLTSVASAEIDGERLALGYARRDAVERGSMLEYAGGNAEAVAGPGASNR